ncbi:MAG: YihA family ribosome biogenesis GTP-binding protein [Saprospiraceae bacterium]|jgi:GTP-binding protein|nr:YihA family ribosome biogenesis GTP-binding protein [Saprospiraceae bacterium]MBP6236043.1 YihA family ribosome biogenesis GTP-binding protein [Saprospiraceae bacterium]MBP6568335.1 YihA family ribosome biogenesis GTP-binding protein [Saprospiraceae bacterium]
MNIKDVEFIASFPKVSACPVDGKPEFAFIGRSNVGKSSLINMLCNRKGMAKVSVTPGKTQLLNYFLINQTWYLVDLPGYGYARLSKEKKAGFGKMIKNYLTQRDTLVVAFVLIDVRHELQKIDKEFIDWLGENSVPFCLVYTKADKLGKNQVQSNVMSIRKELLKSWNDLPDQFITSSETKTGREEILSCISTTMASFSEASSVKNL